MTDRVLVDTNVFIYAFDTHPDSGAKRARALELLADDSLDICVSAQVLSEFFVTVTRKLPRPLPAVEAARAVGDLIPLGVIPTDAHLIAAAIKTSQSAQLSYWDALIVEAAASAGCARVLTEDLNAGAVISGVRIENPFAQPA